MRLSHMQLRGEPRHLATTKARAAGPGVPLAGQIDLCLVHETTPPAPLQTR